MADLSAFPITKRWAPVDPTRIQLYSFPTPNGVKVSAALEELGLAYDAHRVSILDGDQKTDEFLSLNPNGKIPAIIDPDGPGGRPLGLFESGAILEYLAAKTGRLVPADDGEPAGQPSVVDVAGEVAVDAAQAVGVEADLPWLDLDLEIGHGQSVTRVVTAWR